MRLETNIDIVFIVAALVLIAAIIGYVAGAVRRDFLWRARLPHERNDAINRSRAVIGGQFSENMAPFLPDFPYLPTECTFIGKPADLIVFRGYDEKVITEVVFLEIKSGRSRLSATQRGLRDAIQAGNVRWEEYRIPYRLTR